MSALTRAERIHNAACRALQVLAVAGVAGSFFAERGSVLQLMLMLGALAALFVAAWRGRYVEEVEDDE